MMEQILSSSTAPAAFGLALLCAGQLSTFTGTISGREPPLLGSISANWHTRNNQRACRYAQLLFGPITATFWHGVYTFFWICYIDSDVHTDDTRSRLMAVQARWCYKAF